MAKHTERNARLVAVSSLIIGLAMVAGIAFVGLRGDADPGTEPGPTSEPPSSASTAVSDNSTISDSSTISDNSTAAGTAVRAAENVGGDAEFTHWIGRSLMTAESVELVWSPIEGQDVIYRVHRFERVAGFDPDTAPFEHGVVIYSGSDLGVVDSDLAPGQFYTYVLDATVDGTRFPRRWTEALTVDDTEPPSAIVGLMAEVTPEGVELSWEPSNDNVEFAAYSVSIIGEDDALIYIGGGADIGQTTFLDDRPTTGQVTYAVAAADFHGNRTEAATITVTVP